MTRWRRPGASEILWVYMLLAAMGLIVSWRSHSAGPSSPVWPFLSVAFVVWRVSRGGWISRLILIAGSGISYSESAVAFARPWGLATLALIVIFAVQIALLVSPPVYGRTRRPVPIEVRARGWGQLVRRPPAWLLPWGLLSGVLLTLALLGNMDFVAIAGCRPAASDACHTLAEGYPLHWLAAHGGDPAISKEALLKDLAQWALACTSALYLVWNWLTAPSGRAE